MRQFSRQNQPAKTASVPFARLKSATPERTRPAEHGTSRTPAPPFGFDFSQVPVHGKTPAGIQTKLTIGAPGDAFEQEADRVAEQVMRIPQPVRSPAQTGLSEHTMAPAAQVQTKSLHTGDGGIAAPPIVHDVLRSPGQPLDGNTRAFMEPRFGHDFSTVRVHSDARAAESASSIDARAFTSNRSIVFGAGAYAPQTEPGRRLLAHELTHVLQQGVGVRREIDNPLGGHAGKVIQRQHVDASGTVSDQNTAVETAAETPQVSDPLVIEAAVGAKAVNRVDDVAKVQSRLLAIGLLSEADFTAESPRAATPASAQDAVSDAGAVDSIAPETATVAPGTDPGATIVAPSSETNAASAVTSTIGAMPSIVPESMLTATIAAICEFQQPLFGKEIVDGSVGATGPTWRALCVADAAAVAKMKDAWAKKKEDAANKKRKEEREAKLKAGAERQQNVEAEKQRSTIASNLLAQYATYLPFISTYISLDESGLASALVNLAKSNGDAVLKVLDALDANDLVEVVDEMVNGKTVKELATFDRKVLARCRRVVSGAETEQIEQLPIAGTKDSAPFYSQADKRWKDTTLGKSLKMGAKGCAVTSMAMAVSAISGKSIDPSEMDAYLDKHGGYAGDLIVWDKAAQAGGLQAKKNNRFDSKLLDASLAAGRPCVMSVNWDGHWVAVTGKRVENGRSIYTIHDPATGKAADMTLENGALVGAKGDYSKCSGSYIITLEPKP